MFVSKELVNYDVRIHPVSLEISVTMTLTGAIASGGARLGTGGL